MILYRIFYIMMLAGYAFCSCNTPTLRMKIIGILLTIVNGVMFYRQKGFMKKVYVLDFNRNLGSSQWYMDKIYTTKAKAKKRGKDLKKKFPHGGYSITEWGLYE